MADEVTPPLSGMPTGPLTEEAIKNAMYQKAQAQYEAQKSQMGLYDQMASRYGQSGMSDIDKASILFQAAGALSAPTRSGGLMESIGAAGTAVAGPLSKAAQAERDRQDKMAQLQMARAKLSAEMSPGPSPSDLMSLYKLQQADAKDTEKFTVQTYKDPRTGVETPYYAGSQGTIKPIDLKSVGIEPAQAAVGDGLTGDEYLTELQKQDANLAAKVKAVHEGRLTLPPTNSKSADAQRLIQAVTQYDPEGVNDIQSGARRKLFTSFTAGEDANQLKSLNTVMGHLGKLQKTSIELDNTRFPTVNEFLNYVSVKTGEDAVTNFNVAKKAVADELSTVLKGRATEGEVKRWNEAINAAQSPKQLQGAIETAMDLIEGRMQALGNKYEAGMNYKYKTNGGMTLLSPEAQKAYQGIKSTSVVEGKTKKEPEAAPAAPAGKPDAQGWVTLPNGIKIRQKASQE